MHTQICPDLVEQMQRPEFYPHAAKAVDIRETHISMVFLAGEFVYKIKKPLQLEFLDFSTLEKRRYYCFQEVLLNRRLAPNVYLGVLPITHHNGIYRLDGIGMPVEYTVKMRRLPDPCAMNRLIENQALVPDQIHALAHFLVRFYSKSSSMDLLKDFGTWEMISANCLENFNQTLPFSGTLFNEREFKIVRASMMSFLQRKKALFDKRVKSGKIQDCHGDLRADHVYFCQDGIHIIDCIEFNARFRYEDPASDLAFLAMDLDRLGYSALSHQLLTEYVRESQDSDLLVLIEFYKCYRAMVRLKVNCIRLMEQDVAQMEKKQLISDINVYLNLAYGYAISFTRPTLWVVCGLPASGKSAVAKSIGEAFEIRVLQSDMIRKQLFAAPETDMSHLAFEQGMYARGATALTYGRMLLLAQEELRKGNSAVMDATFRARHFRQEALRLAQDMDANIFFVECRASYDTLQKRLAKRDKEPSLSDARLSHFKDMCKNFEPLDEIRPDQHMVIDTENPLEECMRRILLHESIAIPS